MLTLHDNSDSGNGYKLRLLMSLLGIEYRLVQVDIFRGESRTPEFLAKNPNGRIPVLELPDGRCLAESNAILCHLAEGTEYIPRDPWQRALMFQWLFFEQYSHEPNVATPRYWLRHTAADDPRRAQLEQRQVLGRAALAVMQEHLATRLYFADDRFTIADIALYAYTHLAEQGGFTLASYPAVRRWLARCADRPRFAAF
ncbi:MAG TPA: glutathione S-transferase family protein [Polyangiales bacterium]|nr:glutathione S-transferase family protein [Polyangiales bacterium]